MRPATLDSVYEAGQDWGEDCSSSLRHLLRDPLLTPLVPYELLLGSSAAA